MEVILVNYNFTPDWLLEYPELSPVTIFDRSDDGIERNLKRFGKVIKSANIGNVDYDKLSYLVDNYNNLPEVFLWGKSNLFKFITKEEWEKVKDNQVFTPLLTKNHKTYSDRMGVVCKYEGEIYWERHDNWFVQQFSSNFKTLNEFTNYLNIPQIGNYIPFAPGGNYILTKERVHRYSRDFYEKMMDTLPYTQLPAEAHFCERIYYSLWK